jgi:hypothetical protein
MRRLIETLARRFPAQILILLALASGIFVAAIAGAEFILGSGSSTSAKQGAIGDLLAAVAFVLAFVAAVVATLAYRVTILKPDLRAQVRFGHGVDGSMLLLDKRHDPATAPQPRGYVGPYVQNTLHIHLHNYGPVSARNPALKVNLVGMMFPPDEQKGWAFGDHFHGLGGFGYAQWDGGADFSIHPNWGRDLPLLDCSGVRVLGSKTPTVQLDIVADGFSISRPLPITFREAGK